MPGDEFPGAVLIDMDGTLAQTEVHWGSAEAVLMDELGSDWTRADHAHSLGGPLERVVAYMIGKTGGAHDHAEIMELLVTRVEELFRSEPLEWSAGMLDLLNECAVRHIPTALVTASVGRLAAIVVDQLTTTLGRPPFSAIVVSEDVSRGKPSPDPYELAARRLGVTPEECLALEDSPTGVESAVAAGCRVIGIEHMAPLDNSRAIVIDTVEGFGVGELWSLFAGDRAQNR